MTAYKYRRIEQSDLDEVLLLCEEFFNQSNLKTVLDFDKEYTRDIVSGLIGKEEFFGFLVESEDTILGFITAISIPSTFSRDKVVSEQVWYVREEYRSNKHVGLPLLQALYIWSKKIGASYITMGCAENVSNVERIYSKLGLVKVDSTYLGKVT